MSEYITKEEVLNLLTPSDVTISGSYINLVKEEIKLRPSADVVKVVRCKDCIHNDQCKHRVVMWVEDPINTWHKDIDYCSYGERKEQ